MKKLFKQSLVLSLVLILLLQAMPMAGATISNQSGQSGLRSSIFDYVVVKNTPMMDSENAYGVRLTTLSAGTRVHYISGTWNEEGSGYLYVSYGSYTGYVNVSSLCQALYCYKVNTTSGLNLRSGPNTNSDVLHTLAYGTYVYQKNIYGVWYEVLVMSGEYKGCEGYVHSGYLTQG